LFGHSNVHNLFDLPAPGKVWSLITLARRAVAWFGRPSRRKKEEEGKEQRDKRISEMNIGKR